MVDKEISKWLKVLAIIISILSLSFTISPFLLSWISSKPVFYGPELHCPKNFTWEEYKNFTGYITNFTGYLANYGDIPVYLNFDFDSHNVNYITFEGDRREPDSPIGNENSWFFPPIGIGGGKNISIKFAIDNNNLNYANFTVDLHFGEPFMSHLGLIKYVGSLPRTCEYEKNMITYTFELKEGGERYLYGNNNFWNLQGYKIITFLIIVIRPISLPIY